MRHGHVIAAAQVLQRAERDRQPAADGRTSISPGQVEEFNDSMPCGAKLIERPAAVEPASWSAISGSPSARAPECGTGAGERATFAFLIDADASPSRAVDPHRRPGPDRADGGDGADLSAETLAARSG